MSSLIRLPIRLLLEFFDEAPTYSRGHATAIVSVIGEDLGTGLLVDYYQNNGYDVEVLDHLCSQGTKKGKRLDRWVTVTKGRRTTYYQVEIKNWSAHAIGGQRLGVNASPAEAREHKMERWSQEWNGKGFTKESVQKVLTPMKPPVLDAKVEPLICYWAPMHPKGADDALFSVPLKSGNFPRVWVFSMSSYLRGLLKTGNEFVDIEAPAIKARLLLLQKLLG